MILLVALHGAREWTSAIKKRKWTRLTVRLCYSQGEKKKEYMVTLLDEPMHITREKKNYRMLTFLSVGVAGTKMSDPHLVFLRRGSFFL